MVYVTFAPAVYAETEPMAEYVAPVPVGTVPVVEVIMPALAVDAVPDPGMDYVALVPMVVTSVVQYTMPASAVSMSLESFK